MLVEYSYSPSNTGLFLIVHSVVKILTLIAVLLLMNTLPVQPLLMLCAIFSLLAIWKGSGYLKVLGRMRWLWLSILLIYTFTTPGEYIANIDATILPTYEGLQAGVVQIAKLCSALAMLNLLFSTSNKEQLLAALFYILSPLKWLGFNIERFSARLFLTLEYVKVFAERSKIDWHFLQVLHQPTIHISKNKIVNLQLLPICWFDKVAIFVITTFVFSVLLFNVIS